MVADNIFLGIDSYCRWKAGHHYDGFLSLEIILWQTRQVWYISFNNECSLFEHQPVFTLMSLQTPFMHTRQSHLLNIWWHLHSRALMREQWPIISVDSFVTFLVSECHTKDKIMWVRRTTVLCCLPLLSSKEDYVFLQYWIIHRNTLNHITMSDIWQETF